MKKITPNQRNPASSKKRVEELTPRPDPPPEVQKVILSIGGKRHELKIRVSVPAISRGPAKVMEMPRRPAI